MKRVWDAPTAQRYDRFLELISRIEPDASVSATDRLGSHVSSRFVAHRLDQNIDTDYVLIEQADFRGRNKRSLERRQKEETVELVERVDSWSLYRRISPPETE